MRCDVPVLATTALPVSPSGAADWHALNQVDPREVATSTGVLPFPWKGNDMPKIRHSKNFGRQDRVVGRSLATKSRPDSATAASRDLGNCVYVVRTPDRLIKIGWTSDLNMRIRQFGCVWADVLLAFPGTLQDEASLHARFGPYLARGREYYFPAIEIMAWVNEERERLGVPHVA